MERYVLKQNAKDQIRGKWAITILTFLIGGAIAGGGSALLGLANLETAPLLETVVGIILGGLMEFGLAIFSLNLSRKSAFEFTDLFEGFKDKIWIKIIGLYFIKTVMVAVGTCLFIVPGIILSLMFSQSFYILCDDNNKSIQDCLKESMKMMNGHKGDLFVLILSFIGWFLLGVVTCGIGFLWIVPYYQITLTNYYLGLIGETTKNIEENKSEEE